MFAYANIAQLARDERWFQVLTRKTRQMKKTLIAAPSAFLILLACTAGSDAKDEAAANAAASAQSGAVFATAETVAVGTANADAADDPAIWRNPADPAASLIVGTDKKAGLYVYGLDGSKRDFIDAGRVNNVDLRDDVNIQGKPGILVAASDRGDKAQAKIALFRLDPASGRLSAIGKVDAGAGEAYGLCLYRSGAGIHAFIVLKDGTIHQVALDLKGAKPAGTIVRTMKLDTQSEGCAVDERTGKLYVAEEDVGLWRFDARANAPITPHAVAKVDGARLVADAEGVAIAPVGATGGYVLVSSQGDNSYAAYRLSDDSFAGRFKIARGSLGSTEETDGIDLVAGDFGPAFPGGLFVAQDGKNEAGAQNFKLVAWSDVAVLLGK